MTPLRALTFVDYYAPAYKAGGPIAAVENAVERLYPEVQFRILTADRDLGDARAFPNVVPNHWTRVGHAEVMYLPAEQRTIGSLRAIALDTPHDIIWLNSLFSRASMRVLLLRRLGLLRAPVVLAPRGELSSTALAFKPWRKRAYLRVASTLGFFDGIAWQASSAHEVNDIIDSRLASSRDVTLTGEIVDPIASSPLRTRTKVPGELRVVFLARISPMKNLEFVARVLSGMRERISLDVHGPIGDEAYWRAREAELRALPPNITAQYRGVVERQAVRRTLANADVMFLPSLGENFGHAIFEALASGCPVLTSTTTAWRGLDAAGAGWDLPLDDVERFRDALRRLAAMNEETHAGMRSSAVAHARNAATATDAVERHRSMFRSVSTASRSRPLSTESIAPAPETT